MGQPRRPIERGYGGRSIFFEAGHVRADLLAPPNTPAFWLPSASTDAPSTTSTPLPRVLEDEFITEIARIAEALRPWGVQLSLSVDLSTPAK